MALPGFRNHPKFRRLVAALRMPEAHVLGHVEMMWEVCYASGNAVLGDSIDVELAAGWVGEPGVLCRALADCGGPTRSGLIEEVEDGIWQVHDLLDHAPEYVDSRRKRLEEKGKDKVCTHCGATFRTAVAKSRFCSDACRKADWRRRQQAGHETKGYEASQDTSWTPRDRDGHETDKDEKDEDETRQGRTRDGHETDKDEASDHYQNSPGQDRPVVQTPNGVCDAVATAPASAPEGEQVEKPKKPKREKPAKPKKPEDQSLEQILGGKGSQTWERFWKTLNVWPRDKNPAPKTTALAWLKACEKADAKNIYVAALHYRDQFLPPIREADETHFMRSPVVWLNEEGWNTELQALEEPELAEAANA